MAKMSERSGITIEKLLEERSQYEQWLARLADSGAPDAVRDRVRADYERRLQGVIEQLRAHETTITTELTRHELEHSELEEREADVLETLAEAQVRHAVGEYDEAQWAAMSGAQDKALGEVRSALDRVRTEITRLSEVQRLIRAEPAPAPPPPPAKAPPAAAAPMAAPSPSETATPRFVPKPPLQPSPAPKPHGDELDFLKSVAVEQSASLSPAAAERQRSSGGQPMVTSTTPPPEPAIQPAAAPAPTPASAAAPAAKGVPSANTKSLKCGECGTLNRPTEWYCERCGAELAAL